jgi:hypothetical protein
MYHCNSLIITHQFSYCHMLLGCCCKSKIIPSNPSKHAILSLYPLPTLNQIMNILIYESFQDLKVYKVNTSQQNSSTYRDSCCLFLRFCRCLFRKKRSLWPMVLLPPPIIAPSSSHPSAKTQELLPLIGIWVPVLRWPIILWDQLIIGSAYIG